MSLLAFQFTQEQARALAGVSQGDLRHWRKAVPYLAAKPGKSAQFTFADLVGLAIASELIETFGVRITDVGTGIDALFRALAEARPAHLDGLFAVVTARGARLCRVDELSGRHFSLLSLVVPCNPLITKMGARMIPFTPGPDQSALPFPPQILKAGS